MGKVRKVLLALAKLLGVCCLVLAVLLCFLMAKRGVGKALGFTDGVSDLLVKVGEMAPDFTVVDSDGQELRLTDLKGKHVLMVFWGTRCGHYVDDLPKLKSLFAKHSENDLVILGVSVDGDRDEFLSHLRRSEIPWRQVLDGLENEGMIGGIYGVDSLPTYILLDREGTVIDLRISKVPRIPL